MNNLSGPRRLLHQISTFRKRKGKKGSERLLKISLDLFHPKIKEEEVVVDTKVQGKASPFIRMQNWPRISYTPAGR